MKIEQVGEVLPDNHFHEKNFLLNRARQSICGQIRVVAVDRENTAWESRVCNNSKERQVSIKNL